tara:strand:+ start:108 stop:458 length:351 start_codon:yes stop_codon:yes gene_type:complete
MGSKHELFGIYDADGTALGELRYFIEKVIFGKACSLCDITHGKTFQGKEAWRENVCQVEWLHRDEQTESMKSYTSGALPIVIRSIAGGYETVVSADELAACEGDFNTFSKMLAEKL